MHRLLSSGIAAGLCATLLAGSLDAQTNYVAEHGFRLTAQGDLVPGQTYASFADGRYVAFDGTVFALYDAAGVQLQVYGLLPAPVFPSFVALDPSESFAYVGESSSGDLYAIDLAAGTLNLLVNLPFNYDLAFDVDPGFAYVSAATGGIFTGNDILRLNVGDGSYVQVAHIDGPSGPVTVDGEGRLYYVTQSDVFPAPPGSSSILRWTHDQLVGGTLLSEVEAEFFAGPYNGGSDLHFDPSGGDFFLCENDFSTGQGLLRQIDGDGQELGLVATSFDFITNVEVFDTVASPTFFPFQPPDARLHYQFTGFALGINERVTVEPARAGAGFAGPAVGIPGLATVTITDAHPGGSVEIFLARSSLVQHPEVVHLIGWGFPVHTAVPREAILRRTPRLPVDAAGQVSITYFQQTFLQGEMLFQAILFDDTGRPVGTSTHVINR